MDYFKNHSYTVPPDLVEVREFAGLGPWTK